MINNLSILHQLQVTIILFCLWIKCVHDRKQLLLNSHSVQTWLLSWKPTCNFLFVISSCIVGHMCYIFQMLYLETYAPTEMTLMVFQGHQWLCCFIVLSLEKYDCRDLSLSDCRYSLNPLSQTRIDWVERYRIRWTFKLSYA